MKKRFHDPVIAFLFECVGLGLVILGVVGGFIVMMETLGQGLLVFAYSVIGGISLMVFGIAFFGGASVIRSCARIAYNTTPDEQVQLKPKSSLACCPACGAEMRASCLTIGDHTCTRCGAVFSVE